MTESSAEMIGKYRVITNLASGSQGTVYHAYDPDLEREVALKVLHPHLATPEVVARFRREAQLVASINHPNIAGISEIGEHEGSHFLAIEYVPHTARELIDRGPLDITRAVAIAHQAALALEAARTSRRGITHHDIKPENLLLTSLDADGVVKLIDFGIAHAADMAPMTQAGAQWGTPYYMPPEQWMGERGDTRSDVYSLGVVMYQMLSGQVPFSSTAANSLAQQNEIARQHIEVDAASLLSVREDIPEAVQAIVERCMAKSPEERYQTPGELAAELAGVLGVAASAVSQPASPAQTQVREDAPSAPPPVAPAQPQESDAPKPPRRNRVALLAAGGFGAMIVIVLIVLVASQPGGSSAPPEPTRLPGGAPPPATYTPVPLPTETPVPTQTNTPAIAVVPEPTSTFTPTPVPTSTPTPTATPTPTPTNTPRPTWTPTWTPTPRPTWTPTWTPTPSPTPSPTPTPTVTVIPTPTLTPTLTPTPTPTPAPILADLVVDSLLVSPDTPEIWEEVSFTTSVRNEGTAPVGEFAVVLHDGSKPLDVLAVNGLIPGGEEEITLVWRAEAEAKTLTVAADLGNHIAESNERNNEMTYKVEPVIPPYEVDKITWHPEEPAINEEVTFWAHIENTSAFSYEYNAGVIFYLDGVHHSQRDLDRRFNKQAIKQVRSTEWEAQKGLYEVTAVVYPLAYLDPRSNPSSWDEYDERYVIAEDRVIYDATRLPNLLVEEVEFSEDPVPNTDTLHLDMKIVIANKSDADETRTPSVDESFDVLIVFEEGPVCPLRQGRTPCTEEITVDGLRGGSTKSLEVEGGFPVPLPRSGDVHIYEVYIFVDPNNEVEESDEADNERRRTYRLRR